MLVSATATDRVAGAVRSLGVIAAFLFALVAPASAAAASLSISGGTLHYTAGAGERNAVTLAAKQPQQAVQGETVWYFSPAPAETPAECARSSTPHFRVWPENSDELQCPGAVAAVVILELGDGSDRLSMPEKVSGITKFEVHGGPGDDRFELPGMRARHPSAQEVEPFRAWGDAGKDSLEGGGTVDGGEGDDVVSGRVSLGGPGNDQLSGLVRADGGEGNDALHGIGDQVGGPGDDTLKGDDKTLRLDAGPGNDRVGMFKGNQHAVVLLGPGNDHFAGRAREVHGGAGSDSFVNVGACACAFFGDGGDDYFELFTRMAEYLRGPSIPSPLRSQRIDGGAGRDSGIFDGVDCVAHVERARLKNRLRSDKHWHCSPPFRRWRG